MRYGNSYLYRGVRCALSRRAVGARGMEVEVAVQWKPIAGHQC